MNMKTYTDPSHKVKLTYSSSLVVSSYFLSCLATNCASIPWSTFLSAANGRLCREGNPHHILGDQAIYMWGLTAEYLDEKSSKNINKSMTILFSTFPPPTPLAPHRPSSNRAYPAQHLLKNRIFLFQSRGFSCHDKDLAAVGVCARGYYRDDIRFIDLPLLPSRGCRIVVGGEEFECDKARNRGVEELEVTTEEDRKR